MEKYNIKNKLVLVTGGSGFLGKPLIKELLNVDCGASPTTTDVVVDDVPGLGIFGLSG